MIALRFYRVCKGIVFLARKENENFEVPVWVLLNTRWYEKVNRLARKYGLSRVDLLNDAIRLYEKHRKEAPLKKAGTDEESVRKVFSSYAKDWWASLTPEQRKVEAAKRTKAANTRWTKAKKTSKKA